MEIPCRRSSRWFGEAFAPIGLSGCVELLCGSRESRGEIKVTLMSRDKLPLEEYQVVQERGVVVDPPRVLKEGSNWVRVAKISSVSSRTVVYCPARRQCLTLRQSLAGFLDVTVSSLEVPGRRRRRVATEVPA